MFGILLNPLFGKTLITLHTDHYVDFEEIRILNLDPEYYPYLILLNLWVPFKSLECHIVTEIFVLLWTRLKWFINIDGQSQG